MSGGREKKNLFASGGRGILNHITSFNSGKPNCIYTKIHI